LGISRWDQPHLVPQLAQLAPPIVGRGACLHSHQARWQLGKPRQHLRAPQRATHHNRSRAIDRMHLKHLLGQIQTDRCNLFHGWLPPVGVFENPTLAHRRRKGASHPSIAGGVLVVFAIGGTDFLRLLHVSIPAFQVASGILLLLQSIELLFAHPSGLSALTASEEKEARATGEIAVFPLAIPSIAGPASITAAMLLMGQAGANLVRVVVFFLALLLALALTWTALVLVEP